MSNWSEENYTGDIDYVEKILEYFKEAKSESYSDELIRMDIRGILNVFEKEINDDVDREQNWDIEELEEKIDDLETQNDDLLDDIANLEIQNDNLLDKVDELEQKIEAFRGKIRELTGEDYYEDE